MSQRSTKINFLQLINYFCYHSHASVINHQNYRSCRNVLQIAKNLHIITIIKVLRFFRLKEPHGLSSILANIFESLILQLFL